jgi:hypothetical protein
MREFGECGIRKHERELLAANRDEIDTLLTMLKLRRDPEGRAMAWHLHRYAPCASPGMRHCDDGAFHSATTGYRDARGSARSSAGPVCWLKLSAQLIKPT